MINMTRVIFRSGGIAAASSVINRNYRCACVSHGKNRVLHGSWSLKTDQWFISPVATGGAHEFPKRGRRKIANVRRFAGRWWGEKEGHRRGSGFAPTIFFAVQKWRTFGRASCRGDIYLSSFETNYHGCSHVAKRLPSFDRRRGEIGRWDDF